MEQYDVPVRNELTGEIVTMSVTCACSGDAQVQALTQLFRSRGWRKLVAFPPMVESSAALVAEGETA
jgi:hypothetical protein